MFGKHASAFRRSGAALAAGALAILVAGTSTPSPSSISHPSASGPTLPAAAVEGWSLRRWSPAVDSFRADGLKATQQLLAGGSRQQLLLLGLYAHASGAIDLAIDALTRGGDPTGLLEDWRLFQLADALLAAERLPAARAVIELLLAEHPRSPLYPLAYGRHVEIAWEQGDWLVALSRIEAARQSGLEIEPAPRLDELQWEIALQQGLVELQRTTARRLLVEHPVAASLLEVIDLFRQPDGAIDWHDILTPGQLRQRAASLLAAGVSGGALFALETIPDEHRDLDWHYLQAAALTADRRGAAALELLAERPPTPLDRLPELWRLRSAAALEAATVRPGRSNATSEIRQERRDIAWRDLWQLATRDDGESRRSALERIYELADPEENFELALDALRRLRALDPSDVTGYRDLWKLGWRAFLRDDATAAIGVWRELQNLYPETSTARQALYWSAIAHAELGNRARGEDLLTEVLATDTVDFYSRHAARRLGVPVRREERTVIDSWPHDPSLARAALLSELGLDQLAAKELELLREHSDQRAVDGLEALILARSGERRESIQAVWRAFRSLGKPGQTAVPELVRQLYYPLEFEEIVQRWAADRGLPPFLVYGIIRQESAFDAGAVSRAGARGLMQVLPSTGRELAGKLRLPYSRTRLTDPDYSVRLGTEYFSQVLEMFDGNVELALAGYNGGPYRLKRWWREAGPDPEVDRFIEGLSLSETTAYVKRILIFEDSYRRLYDHSG